jgi:hypothetical protein
MTDIPSPVAGRDRSGSEDALKRWRRRRRRLRRRLRRTGDVILVLLVIVVIVAVLDRNRGGHPSPTTVKVGSLDALYPPTADAALIGCRWLNYTSTATVFVKNHTGLAERYYIDVVFRVGPTKVAEAVGTTPALGALHTMVLPVKAATSANAGKQLTCKIVSVDRLS